MVSYRRSTSLNQGINDNMANNKNDEFDDSLACLISTKRQWGILLGLSKKAIENSIETGKVEALEAVLQGFVGANQTSRDLHKITAPQPSGARSIAGVDDNEIPNVQNPAVVKGKGRPRGSLGGARRGVATHRDPNRPPLHHVPADHANAQPSREESELPMTQTYPTDCLSLEPSSKKQKTCGLCHGAGHNARTCKMRLASA